MKVQGYKTASFYQGKVGFVAVILQQLTDLFSQASHYEFMSQCGAKEAEGEEVEGRREGQQNTVSTGTEETLGRA